MPSIGLVLASTLWAPSVSVADQAPPWLRQAAAAAASGGQGAGRAAILLDEARVLVEEGGRITTTHRRAVRILTREGRREAAGRVIYQTGTGKVKSMRGWMIWPDGGVREYAKDHVVDVEAAPNDVYNEVRAQVVLASDEAVPGAVFGAESVLEDKSVFTQLEWEFQDDLAVAISRISISVPAGWRPNGVVYNHEQVDPVVAGTSYTWELRDLAPIELEPHGPALSSIAPWLAVSLVPSPGASTGIGKTFASWQEVARWLSDLAEPQTAASAPLAEKARSLAHGAASEFDRIRAIGRYVQEVNYVSIQTGVGRGGGYRPHAAADVFAKSYGDCKDKANLMRAMLKVIGLDSYPVAAFSSDRAHVREDWPSPQQFNHAIVAVPLTEAVDAAAVGSYPGLGRLLFFDPTDPHTPMGLVPAEEEGSQVLLVARDRGELLRMPSSGPEANRLERHLDLSLGPDGSLAGRMEELAYGHAATARRRTSQPGPSQDRKRMESRLAKAGSGAEITSLDSSERADHLRLALEFRIPRYARSMGGTLLVLNANVLPASSSVHLAAGSRKYPVVLESEAIVETLRMRLPDGFEVDELPRPAEGTASFGAHSWSCVVNEGYLICRHSVTVKGATVPAERYEEARSFFAHADNAAERTLVLSRRGAGQKR